MQFSLDHLIMNTDVNISNIYESKSIKAYTTELSINFYEYEDLKDKKFTNSLIQLCFDMSYNKIKNTIIFIELTPRNTDSALFMQWLRNNIGYGFTHEYLKSIFESVVEYDISNI